MKITGIRTSMMRVDRQNWLFVHIDTDAGITRIIPGLLDGLTITALDDVELRRGNSERLHARLTFLASFAETQP